MLLGSVVEEFLRKASCTVEVVKEFYTTHHGGLTIYPDPEKLELSTGYIEKKTKLDFTEDRNRVQTSYGTPIRQQLFLRVLSTDQGVEIEIFATLEALIIDDPESIDTPEDLWKIVKQDKRVEELLFERLCQRLVEKEMMAEESGAGNQKQE